MFITFISPIFTIHNPQKMINLHFLQLFLKNKAKYHIHYNSIYHKKCKYMLRPILGHNCNYLIIYCWHANAKMAIFLNFSLFCLLKMYKKNLTKNMKCSWLKCEPVYFTHCKNPLNCSHISLLMPSNPSILTDLKLFPQTCVMD